MTPSTLFKSTLRHSSAIAASVVLAATGIGAAFAQPAISSLSAYSGIAGTSVAVHGSGFNTTPANNIVYFGSARGTVTAATTTSLTVTVPMGTTYKPLSVLNTTTSLTGFSDYPFYNTYNNSAYVSNTVNFRSPVIISTDRFPNQMNYGDIDGDGKVDIVTNNYSAGTITIFRNTSSIGSVSYALPDTINSVGSPGIPTVGDVDGDGKLDVITVAVGHVYISRNTSTPGSVSFAPIVTLSVGGANAVSVADIDSDGKADIIVGGGNVITILRNTGSPGTISFASPLTFTALATTGYVSAGDVDGDGKPDVVACYGSSSNVSVFR